MSKHHDAARSLEQAAAITKACAGAGITDPAEIPALITYARVAEEFSIALVAHDRALREYERFVATHGADDPGQEYFVAQLNSAREVLGLARRVHHVALQAWRVDRGLELRRAA